jgi:hydroxymethylpyrimidine pyrophosphatase-like HAD family hydrolase
VIRFASLDLDGTAGDSGGRIGPDVVSGVRRWREAGVRWHVVTGRSGPAVLVMPGIDDLLAECEPTILIDGAEVELDPGSGARRLLARLSSDVVQTISRHCPDVVISAEGLVASSPRAARIHTLAYRLPRGCVSVGTVEGESVNRLTVYGMTPPVLPGARQHRIGRFDAVIVTPIGAGKAAGYEAHLRRSHDGSLEQSIAFGDDDSDAMLLARSAAGIAMPVSSALAVEKATLRLDVSLGEFLTTTHPAELAGR